MKQIFSQQMAQKGLLFEVNVDPALPDALLLDDGRLRQVLMNLLGNAVKFTTQGRITLSVRKQVVENDPSVIRLIFIVEDTGIGISYDQQQKIFEAFHQQEGQSYSTYGGTGLGLAICLRLVRLMGGEITVDSRLGQGSRFDILLPEVRVEMSPTTDVSLNVTNPVVFKQADILIVDDLETNRYLLGGLLDESPFTLRMASNGVEALDAIEERMPDLVLLDIKMPVMDGCECAASIRAQTEWDSIVIIAVTASAVQLDDAGPEYDPFDHLIHKPITKQMLLDAIKPFLEHEEQPLQVDEWDRWESDLSMLSVAQLRSLLALLESDTLPLLQEVIESLNVAKIKKLAMLLKSVSKEYRLRVLEELAGALEVQAGCFDMTHLAVTLRRVSSCVEKIRKGVNEYGNQC